MKKRLLSVLRQLAFIIVGMICGNILTTRKCERKYKKLQAVLNKNLVLYEMLNQWIKIKQENKSISDYLEKNNFHDIAIYGMNHVGQTLKNELKGSPVCVRYGIDNRADEIYSDIEVVTLEDELPAVDAVIVTPVYYIYEIEAKLRKKMSCPIVSLQDILNEL